MYAYCAERGIPHSRIGKIVVASEEAEIPALHSYQEKAAANGVSDLRWLSIAELRDLEPAVSCVAGFLSPSTGIVDSHAFMLALQGDGENHGAMLVTRTPMVGGEVRRDGILLRTGGDDPAELLARTVVNSAGLFAQAIAASLVGFPAMHMPPAYFAKAHYFTLSGRSPFRRLVYPIATQAHLGVHVTLDLGGQARFGPDVSWVAEVDYGFDDSREASFVEAIRCYWPGLPDGAIQPGYTGIRPKLAPEGAPAADFRVDGPEVHGVPGLVNLFGIESPGLTASLALGRQVRRLLEQSPE